MDDKRDNRFVDNLLDRALENFRRAQPAPGLEGCILDRLEAEAARGRQWRWVWVPVAATAAVVLAATVVYVNRWAAPPPVESVTAVPGPPAVTTAVVPPAPQPVKIAPRAPVATAQRPAAPRLAQFPSPAPLSEQERLLLRYVQQASPEQLLAASLGEGKLAELRLEPLRIPPLASEPN